MGAVSIPSPLQELREARHLRRIPDPCAVVIFGATGDLTHRKLMPALYTLSRLGMLPEECAVVGFARRPRTDEQCRVEVAQAVRGATSGAVDAAAWDGFARRLHYVQADFRDPAGYDHLRQTLERLDRECGTTGNRLYYLATAPELYGEIVQRLGQHGLTVRPAPGSDGGHPWTRVIVEKPIGRDLASAQDLNRALLSVFRESQIFRIDHYLGKETVQNILVFRFANGIFEPIWNQHYVDHVQITVAETVGVENRAGYYETAGVVRGVAPTSRTPTFVAMRLYIDNWRWAGVPFYLRSGKRLPKRVTEVAVQFKRAPLPLFGDTGADEPNLLVLNIQPDEVISLQFVAKVPGLAMTLRPVTMGFRYGTAFGVEEMSAYERLLLDALLGDSTLFTRRDEVEEAWDLVEPLLNWWERSDPPEPVPMYAAGTWGPDAARALIARRGRRWRSL